MDWKNKMKTFKELMVEFNFNKAKKSGYLDDSDKPLIKKIEKSHKIVSFLLSSEGYELRLKCKKTGKTKDYVGKNPQVVLKQAVSDLEGK